MSDEALQPLLTGSCLSIIFFVYILTCLLIGQFSTDVKFLFIVFVSVDYEGGGRVGHQARTKEEPCLRETFTKVETFGYRRREAAGEVKE